MKNSRKAQVVIFIIIGIAILVATGLLYYIVTSTAQQRSASQIEQQKLAAELIQPVDDYVTACLKATSQDALELLGKQGGVIWVSQGGLSTGETDAFQSSGQNISYGIITTHEILGTILSTEPPVYPYSGFPYISGTTSFVGIFGRNNLPPSNLNSVKNDLEHFIELNISGCIDDWKSFFQQGLNISGEGDKAVSAVIGASDVSFKLNWPLTITAPNGQTAAIDSFATAVPIRLKKILNFTYSLVAKETKEADYNIAGRQLDGITSSAAGGIVTLKDSKSVIVAKPFEFRFAVANRPPALHDVDGPLNNVYEFCSGAKLYLENNNKTVIVPAPSNITLNATDPDGDFVEFKLFDSLNQEIGTGVDAKQLSGSSEKIKITATDISGASDYQEITIQLKITTPC